MDELVLFLVFFAIVGLVTASFRVFKPKRIVILQYQRGVLFNKGVVERVLDPGPYWIPSPNPSLSSTFAFRP
jgi:hypothetical protein